ncbi:MAG: hypothetical protein RRY54_04035, partial [Angelakisella sp.]
VMSCKDLTANFLRAGGYFFFVAIISCAKAVRFALFATFTLWGGFVYIKFTIIAFGSIFTQFRNISKEFES